MKRKVLGILLLFCLVAPVVATFTFLRYQKSQVRREVKWKMIAGLDKEELVLLKFTEEESQTELRWEHSKEFEYKGQMYDIVEKSIQGDTIYYWCWWDHEETKLNKQLDGLLANVLGNNPQRQEKKSQLADFFKKLFHESKKTHLTEISNHRINCFFYSEDFTSIYHAPPVPHPALVK
ncbi:MAG: hypothetical protein U5L96_09340 [Owenweeksia sp.]|nr:hypothetical protein [Owenweeksia sp.]